MFSRPTTPTLHTDRPTNNGNDKPNRYQGQPKIAISVYLQKQKERNICDLQWVSGLSWTKSSSLQRFAYACTINTVVMAMWCRYGSIPVDVVVKKELLRSGPQRMLFHKFLKQFTREDWYLTNYIPQEMMHELHVSHHTLIINYGENNCKQSI